MVHATAAPAPARGVVLTLPGRSGAHEVELDALEAHLGKAASRIWQTLLTLRDDCRQGNIHPPNTGIARRAHVTPKQLRAGLRRLRQAGLLLNLGAKWASVRHTTSAGASRVPRKVFWRHVLGRVTLTGTGGAEVPQATVDWLASAPKHGGARQGAGRPKKCVSAVLPAHLNSAPVGGLPAHLNSPPAAALGIKWAAKTGNQVGTPVICISTNTVRKGHPSLVPSEPRKSVAPLPRRGTFLSLGDRKTGPANPPRGGGNGPAGTPPGGQGNGPRKPRTGILPKGLVLVRPTDGGRAYYAPAPGAAPVRKLDSDGMRAILAGNTLGNATVRAPDLGMPLGEMRARGWIPPLPGDTIRQVVLPEPPVLREENEEQWAESMAKAYRAAAGHVSGKPCWIWAKGLGKSRQMLADAAVMLFNLGISPLAWCVWSMQRWAGFSSGGRCVIAPPRWVFDLVRIQRHHHWFEDTNTVVGGQVIRGRLYDELVRKFGEFRTRLGSAHLWDEDEVRQVVAEFWPDGWEAEYAAAAAEQAANKKTLRDALREGAFIWATPKAGRHP